jgi:hypothetical protein
MDNGTANGATSISTLGLAAFADAANYTLITLCTDIGNSTFTPEAGYTHIGTTGATTRYAAYLNGNDITPSATMTSIEYAAYAYEIAPAAAAATSLVPALDAPAVVSLALRTPAIRV